MISVDQAGQADPGEEGLNILVVDDEPRHLRGMVRLITDIRPGYAVRTAKNGNDAMQIHSVHPADIVITDIRMPSHDGLELTRRIHESSRGTQIIVLSGYATFEYAREALSAGACEYALKPVDAAKLDRVIAKAEKAIQQETLREKELTRLRDLTRDRGDEKTGLVAWCFGEDGREAAPGIFYCRGDCSRAALIAAVPETTREIRPDVFLRIFAAELSALPADLSGSLRPPAAFSIDPAEPEAFVLFMPAADRMPSWSRLGPLLEGVRRRMSHKIGRGVVLSVSSFVYSPESRGERLLRETRNGIKAAFYGGQGVYFNAEPPVAVTPGIPEIDDAVRELCENLIRDENASVRSIVAGFTETVGRSGSADPPSVIRAVRKLLRNTVDRLIPYASTVDPVRMKDDVAAAVMCCRTNDALVDAGAQALMELRSSLAVGGDVGACDAVLRCRAHIDACFDEDLSLEVLAEEYGFSPSYFSVLFKTFAGMTFVEYLSLRRLARAEELLAETDARIGDVAEECGFHSSKYFSRVFRSHFGVTPVEYRRANR